MSKVYAKAAAVLLFCLLLIVATGESKDLFRIVDTTGAGFMDRAGKVVISPKFVDVGDFSEGLAAFMDSSELIGFIDTTGTIVIPPKFKAAYADLSAFDNGLALVGLPNSNYFGFITHSGAAAFPDSFAWASSFSEGLAMVKADSMTGLSGFIDTTGKWVIPPKFIDAANFHEGVAIVYFGAYADTNALIDRTGKILFGPTTSQIVGVNDGVIVVTSQADYQKVDVNYYDLTGKPLATPSPWRGNNLGSGFLFSEGLGGTCIYDSTHGWQAGFMNRQGETVITPAYYEVSPFIDGLSLVTISKSMEIFFAYIDTHGTIVIPPDIDGMKIGTPGDFKNGLAWVLLQGKDSQYYAYINKTGKIIWKSKVKL